MKRRSLSLMSVFTLVGVILGMGVISIGFFPQDAEAVPAFSRQTGWSCNSCHSNSFPSLNKDGRKFVRSGYTQIEDQEEITGERLSIPDVLNASLVTKFRYQKSKTKGSTNKSGTDKGEWQFPDEAALFLAGRAGENIGFVLEGQLADGEMPVFASFKAPIRLYTKDGTNVSIIPFMTDALGASFGFELLSTGAVRHNRTWEARKAMSAQQYIGLDGNAEGFAVVLANNQFFINASLWAPVHGNADTGFNLSKYIRAAVTPTVNGWDIGAGIQLWSGETKLGDTDANPIYEYRDNKEPDPNANIFKTNATAIDAQAQGKIKEKPVAVYLSWGNAPKTSGTETNWFNKYKADKSAFAIAGELAVIPNKVIVGGGYRLGKKPSGNTTEADNALLLGGKYMLAQNSQLQLNYETYSGKANDSDGKKTSLITVMLFSAF